MKRSTNRTTKGHMPTFQTVGERIHIEEMTDEMLKSIEETYKRFPTSVSMKIKSYPSQHRPVTYVKFGGREQLRKAGRNAFSCTTEDAQEFFEEAHRRSQNDEKVAAILNSVTRLFLSGVDIAQTVKLGIVRLFPNLVHVAVSECANIPHLHKVVHVENLKHLQSHACDLSESLSLTGMTALESLEIECRSVFTLPQRMDLLVNLKELSIQNCTALGDRPKEIAKLKNLKSLKLYGCHSFYFLPAEFGGLVNLEELKVSWCDSLHSLPKEICLLSKLKTLEVGYCHSFQCLPEEVTNLVNLEHLEITNCSSLESMPKKLGKLRNLKLLKLRVPQRIQPMCPLSIARLPDDCVLEVDFRSVGLDELIHKSFINLDEYQEWGRNVKDLTVAHLSPYCVPYLNVIDRSPTGITKLRLLLCRAKENLYRPGGPGFLRAKAEFDGLSADFE